jgi:hypothetical protein
MGRPLKINKKVIEEISSAISIGASYDIAARYARVSYPTFQNWQRLGKKARTDQESGIRLSPTEKLYLMFLTEIETAEGEAGIRWVDVINKSARIDPQWAAWMLTRHFPDGFGKKPQTQYNIDIDWNKLTRDQLQRIANGENPIDVVSGTSQGETTSA